MSKLTEDNLNKEYSSLNSTIKQFISAAKFNKMPKEIQQYLQKVKGKDLTDTQLLYLSKMPWGNSKVYNRSISEAKNILNNTHSGMSDVKDRILRYIACQKRVGSNYGAILLLVGPPGVGKTSIASAVAEAMGMKKCNEVEEVGALIEQLEACHRNIISRLPVLGRAFFIQHYQQNALLPQRY